MPNLPEMTGRLSEHAHAEFGSDLDELDSTLERTTPEQREAQISGHLVRLIDFFFGLVAAQGVLRFDTVFAAPWHANWQVVLAIAIVYYTVIRSFIAWHSAIEQWRYRILVRRRRTTELWRVYTDIVTVIVYAFLLLSAEPLVAHPGANIAAFFFGFPALFLLYGVWGYFRRLAWGADDPFNLGILIFFFAAFLLVAIVYAINPDIGISEATGNATALTSAGALMLLYRFINWWQSELYEDTITRWHGIPMPSWPRLKVD